MAARESRSVVLVVALVLAGALLGPGAAAARDRWSYPPLSLAVAHVDGKVYVGAQAWAPDGCESLVGSVDGRRIRIKGMYEPPADGYGCTAAMEPDWYAVRVKQGWTVIRVRYRGRTGKYSVRVTDKGVHTRHRGWNDVAPPESERWWWTPEDGLIAHVWYGRADAIERVSDRVDEMLREKGATTFETPQNWVIAPTSRSSYAPGSHGKSLADGWTEDLRSDSRTRVYISDLTKRELRRIAHRAAQTERCTYVSLAREPLGTGGIYGRPPCDRS